MQTSIDSEMKEFANAFSEMDSTFNLFRNNINSFFPGLFFIPGQHSDGLRNNQ